MDLIDKVRKFNVNFENLPVRLMLSICPALSGEDIAYILTHRK